MVALVVLCLLFPFAAIAVALVRRLARRPGPRAAGPSPAWAEALGPVAAPPVEKISRPGRSGAEPVGAPRPTARDRHASTARSDVARLKTKRAHAPQLAKRLRASFESESQVMKAKPHSPTEAELLRRKPEPATPEDIRTETGRLKKKLAAAKPPGRRPQAGQLAKLRALPDLAQKEKTAGIRGQRGPRYQAPEWERPTGRRQR